MSDTGVPGVYTVQIYDNNGGQAYVVGVKNVDIQNKIISYIKYVKQGEKYQDWYELFRNVDLLDVVKRARILDDRVQIYQLSPSFVWVYILVNFVVQPVDSTSRAKVRKYYVVLFYVQNTEYKLCAMKESDQKTTLGTYITHRPVEGNKEVDWYRVDNEDDIKTIIDYAKGDDVEGVIYDLTPVPN